MCIVCYLNSLSNQTLDPILTYWTFYGIALFELRMSKLRITHFASAFTFHFMLELF